MLINENDLRKIIKKALLEFRIEKISGTQTNDLARLDIGEERIVRRVADLIKIKDLEVLKLKDLSKSNFQS